MAPKAYKEGLRRAGRLTFDSTHTQIVILAFAVLVFLQNRLTFFNSMCEGFAILAVELQKNRLTFFHSMYEGFAILTAVELQNTAVEGVTALRAWVGVWGDRTAVFGFGRQSLQPLNTNSSLHTAHRGIHASHQMIYTVWHK